MHHPDSVQPGVHDIPVEQERSFVAIDAGNECALEIQVLDLLAGEQHAQVPHVLPHLAEHLAVGQIELLGSDLKHGVGARIHREDHLEIGCGAAVVMQPACHRVQQPIFTVAAGPPRHCSPNTDKARDKALDEVAAARDAEVERGESTPSPGREAIARLHAELT